MASRIHIPTLFLDQSPKQKGGESRAGAVRTMLLIAWARAEGKVWSLNAVPGPVDRQRLDGLPR